MNTVAKPGILSLVPAGMLLAWSVLPQVTAAPADAAPPDAETPCSAYRELKFDLAISLARTLLDSDAPAAQKLASYKCLACTQVALRDLDAAKSSIGAMLTLDPSARFSPDYAYPPPVIELYHLVADSLQAEPSMDFTTIAIGDFEDNSIYTGGSDDLDFSRFQRVLVHTVTADLAQATSLRIVDRQRTRTILEEIELGRSGFVTKDQSARFGRLLGAQTFIFGQYVILSKKKVRIDARVVHTETGEIIHTAQVTGEFAGDPEKFLELEKQLVLGLAEGIENILAAGGAAEPVRKDAEQYFKAKKKQIKNRQAYVEAKFLVAEALELEDRGKYSDAMKVWQRVREKDPENEVARVRIPVLESLAQN